MTMKLNKRKGKVHPSPPSSSSSSSSSSSCAASLSSAAASWDPVSDLNLLLPAAILTLISSLSLQDRQVLAYMITRSLKSPTNTNTNPDNTNTNRKTLPHKSPSFDCGCFECYTTYWFRWDSSPHRELIHQAIEAFEEHLASTERVYTNNRARRRSGKDKSVTVSVSVSTQVATEAEAVVAEAESPEVVLLQKGECSPERENDEEMSGARRGQQQHKGLARKMLPDVIGLMNSRLWNLWGPNV